MSENQSSKTFRRRRIVLPIQREEQEWRKLGFEWAYDGPRPKVLRTLSSVRCVFCERRLDVAVWDIEKKAWSCLECTPMRCPACGEDGGEWSFRCVDGQTLICRRCLP